ncbi:MAG: hypothetical protein ACTIN7_03820 [Lactococcus lactis]
MVASNSLTISNVNDGTITHTAYSYSADGTDRFTTVYPNLNLLVNSSANTKDGFFKAFDKVENGYGEVTLKGTNTWAAIDMGNAFSIKPRDYKPNDIYTMSMDVMFTSWNLPAGTTISEFWMGQRYSDPAWKNICIINLHRDPSKMLNQWIRITQTSTIPPYEDPSVGTYGAFVVTFNGPSEGSFTIRVRNPKQEPGSIATPHMPSASEVTTADWPSYIGQYTDFTQADSTNPSDYTWSLIRGNDGADGQDGKNGTNGKDGDPGKVVSETEPTTRFKGLTWKYSGTSDLTASDGTVINPNTEYYYNGTHWMINYLSANNLEANSIKADKIDAKNLTITDGEFVSTTTNGPVTTSTEIKDNHIAISKTDGTVNTKNDLAVDTEQGFAMKFTNNTTGLTREASVNFQGVSTSDSNGNYAQLTPQGTKLSTDVPWTDITRASGVGTSGTLRARINNGVFYAQSKDVTIPSIAPNSLITIGTMSSKFSGVSGFDTLGLLYSLGQLSVASVTVGNDGKINIGNPNPTTMSGKVIQFSINIPLG